jgi:hypothetical protein
MATLVEIDTEDGVAIAFIGRIYQISAPGYGKVYVGSTKREFKYRLAQHNGMKRCYERGETNYCSSFEILAYPGATIELLEEDAYLDMQHMRDREAFWIQQRPSLNIHTPERSNKEATRIGHARKKECHTCGRHVRLDDMKEHRATKRCMNHSRSSQA